MPGVVGASVGYTGISSDAPSLSPTYKSVCDGDGHTEAVRVIFDPSVLRYEDLLLRFASDPKVPNNIIIYDGTQQQDDPQYQVAIWVASNEQRETALDVCAQVGKNIPVLDATPWFDAEDNHQNFFGGY